MWRARQRAAWRNKPWRSGGMASIALMAANGSSEAERRAGARAICESSNNQQMEIIVRKKKKSGRMAKEKRENGSEARHHHQNNEGSKINANLAMEGRKRRNAQSMREFVAK